MAKARAVLLLMVILALSSAICLVHATAVNWARHATLDVRNDAGVATIQFKVGDTVHFNWTADGMVNVTLYLDPDYAHPIMSWNSSLAIGNAQFVAQQPGDYEVDCTGASPRTLAVGTFFVVPDVPLGPLMSIAACLAAFGIMILRRPKFQKI